MKRVTKNKADSRERGAARSLYNPVRPSLWNVAKRSSQTLFLFCLEMVKINTRVLLDKNKIRNK